METERVDRPKMKVRAEAAWMPEAPFLSCEGLEAASSEEGLGPPTWFCFQ